MVNKLLAVIELPQTGDLDGSEELIYASQSLLLVD
jgi:hypothetical protein